MNPRIAVNGKFTGQRVTGVQRSAQEITQRLGEKVRLITPSGNPQGLRGHGWEQVQLPRAVDRDELLWSPANTGPVRVSKQVVTIHDVSVLDHPEWFSRAFAAWYRILLPALARRVRRVITDSEFSKGQILTQVNIPEGRVHVIPLGVSDEFKPSTAGQIHETCKRYELNSPYLLVVGSLEPRKNLRRLFQAWQLAYHKKPAGMLAVAGLSGRNFRSTGFEDPPAGVQFLGYVAESDLPALYSGATGLVFPSIYEGFGLPALEAMACGTPVAASRVTSLPEVVGDSGLLFDPFSMDDITGALEKLLEDQGLRSELHLRGLERARLFSWEVTAEKTWEVLCQAYEEKD